MFLFGFLVVCLFSLFVWLLFVFGFIVVISFFSC
jgi:hypothetical protein